MPEAGQILTRALLCGDIRALGVRPGDTLMVHAAISRVGRLMNGPDALIGALLDSVGPAGTIMAYASWDTLHDGLLDPDGRVLAEWRAHAPPFDPALSRAVRMNGVLPEFMRTTPGARRSRNPGASMVAIGARADWLTADHPLDYGYGDGSPLAKLLDAGGRVLMIGAPYDTMTMLHLAEHRAAIPGKRVIRYEVPYAVPAGTDWRMTEEFDTSEPVREDMPEDCFDRIVRAFVAAGQGNEGRIGAAPSLLVDAAEICAFAVAWIEKRYGG